MTKRVPLRQRPIIALVAFVAGCTANIYGPDRTTCIEERPDTVATISADNQPLAYIIQPKCWALETDDGKVWVRVKQEDGTETWERR